jgi:hypothetical protein
MKRYTTLSIAILMLAVGLSTAPTNARAKSDFYPAFPLILDIGY